MANVYHQVTSGTNETSNPSNSFGDEQRYHNTARTTGGDVDKIAPVGDSSKTGLAAESTGVTGTEKHGAQSVHPLREEIPERKGSLSSTPGPFQVPTTDNLKGTSVPPTSSVSSQNAPGKAGEVGEKIMGALGVGGTHVERPKEEQGIGEKIVNFLGV